MEYLSSHSWIIWSIIAIILALLELSTGGFYIMCLAFGAFVVIPTTLITTNTFILVSIFSIASLFALFFIKPVMVKRINKNNIKSNVSAIIGAIGVVSEAIEEDGFGRVKVGGDDWKAQTENGAALPAGAKVRVTKQDSVIITVAEITTKNTPKKETTFYLGTNNE